MLKEDKDQYFKQLDNQSKDIKPIQDFIELCGLDKGFFLEVDDNLKKTSEREGLSVRKGWAGYLMEQAWLQSSSRAADYFEWSVSLHQEIGGKRVKSNLKDSMALSNIYFEQALYYLRQGQNKSVDQNLKKSTNLYLGNTRIEFFQVLLNWHEGQQQKAFDQIFSLPICC